jgi:hypothetical protein
MYPGVLGARVDELQLSFVRVDSLEGRDQLACWFQKLAGANINDRTFLVHPEGAITATRNKLPGDKDLRLARFATEVLRKLQTTMWFGDPKVERSTREERRRERIGREEGEKGGGRETRSVCV